MKQNKINFIKNYFTNVNECLDFLEEDADANNKNLDGNIIEEEKSKEGNLKDGLIKDGCYKGEYLYLQPSPCILFDLKY